MPEKKIASIEGILPLIKDDLKLLKNNDSNKTERISKNETKIESLQLWREHHVKDNDETSAHLKELEEYIHNSLTKIYIAIIGLIIALALDFIRILI